MTKAFLMVCFFAGSVHAAEEPSALVETEPLRQQRLAAELTGYGVVSPDTGSTVNINFPHAGQVVKLNVTAGQIVKRGEILLELATDPLAILGFAQARSALEFSRSELSRVQSLVKQQLATQSQLAAAEKAWLDAQAVILEQQHLGTGAITDKVRAPFDGVVTAVSVARSDRIQAGTPAVQLARRDSLRVQLGIEPEDSLRIRPGMPVRLVSVFNDEQQIGGVVNEVHGMVNSQTQLVDVSVRIEKAQSALLLPGMRVRGVIAVRDEKVWAVPRSAVLKDDQGSYIYQNDRGHARRVSVTTGLESGNLIGISGRFDTHQSIVVLGNYELRDGMALRETAK